MVQLQDLSMSGWHFGIGDPTLLGWLTVAAYLLAAALCVICAWRVDLIFRDSYTNQHRLIWGGLALLMLGLGINKQLDLQTLFSSFIRTTAARGGWYEYGQRLQVVFVIGLVAVSLGMVIGIGYWMRHVWRRYWLLLLGTLALARYIIVRVASFYEVPLPRLSRLTGGFQINWLLEIIGALLVAAAAALNLRARQPEVFQDGEGNGS